MQGEDHVFVDTPAWFIRPKNTDWLYMRQIEALERYVDVKVIYPHDVRDVLHKLGTYVVGRFRRAASQGSGRYFGTGRSSTGLRTVPTLFSPTGVFR